MGFKSSAPMGSKVAATAVPARPARARRGALEVVAGNTNEGGLFAPIVVVARNIIGVKRFNQIRGKAIALHSQVRVRSLVPPPAKAAQRHHRERLVSARITNDPPRARARAARARTRARRVRTRRNPARPPSPRHSARDGPPRPLPAPAPPRARAGDHRLLQGDRRGRQGSPEPRPHRQEQRRQARLPRVSDARTGPDGRRAASGRTSARCSHIGGGAPKGGGSGEAREGAKKTGALSVIRQQGRSLASWPSSAVMRERRALT